MKLAPIILFILVTLTICYARTVESICKQGSEVFCATEENARLCGQLEFCSHKILEDIKIERVTKRIEHDVGGQWYWWG